MDPNFKSIISASDRHLYVPWNIVFGSSDWAHHSMIKGVYGIGDSQQMDFYDPSYKSNGAWIYNSGETSSFHNCRFDRYNDWGMFFDRYHAPASLVECTAFHNRRGGFGIANSALAVINIDRPSGDGNPVLIHILDDTVFNPAAANVGGVVNIICPKNESYAAATNTTINSGLADVGRGQITLLLEGNFECTMTGGQQFCHDGYVDSAVRIVNPANCARFTWQMPAAKFHFNLIHDTFSDLKYHASSYGGPGSHLKEFGIAQNTIHWKHNNGSPTCTDEVGDPVPSYLAACDNILPSNPANGSGDPSQAYNHQDCALNTFGFDLYTGL